MRAIRCMIIVMLGGLITPPAAAGTADPLFQSQETLSVEITAPLSTLLRARSETEYLPGVFSYREADGAKVDLKIRIRTRGNFRNRNCDFPPVTLNFSRTQVAGTLLDRQNKLKMVVHCKITRQYEQAVVREYLAYRLLNTLTDVSFRVRLLQVVWVDSEERRGTMVRSAFLIEDRERLAERIGMQEQEIERTEVSALEPEYLNLVSMFQYLIGNVDFSPIAGSGGECCHNHAMYGRGADSLVAIPYDFDFAGIVNAPNAVIDRERGVERLGQRVYRGYCANNGFLGDSIARFGQVRERLYAVVAGQKELEPDVRGNIARYMDGFFEVIDDPVQLEREILGKCL
ncbi:MAG: hypothetical protein P8Y52_06265 [Xanthomonadales bacterium]